MKRSWAAVALVLAALLPLARAHCIVMGPPQDVPACAPMSPDHSCCAPAPAAAPDPAKAPEPCPCIQLPTGTLPQAISVAPITSSVLFALVPTTTCVPMVALVETPVPALDVGSPPLPPDPAAHGLRAPPLAA